jgi:hypothetical protein
MDKGSTGAPFRIFIVSVWNHWEARFGTIFAVAVATIQAVILNFGDPTKIPGWVKALPPWLWLAIGVLFIFWSCYAAWKDQYVGFSALQQKLESPRFVFDINTRCWGQLNGHFSMTLGVSITNPTGPPAALHDWEMEIEHEGHISRGVFPPPRNQNMQVPTPGYRDAHFVFSRADYLMFLTLDPIPSGGVKAGWILAVFDDIPAGSRISGSVTLTAHDAINEKAHSGRADFGMSPDNYIPGMPEDNRQTG